MRTVQPKKRGSIPGTGKAISVLHSVWRVPEGLLLEMKRPSLLADYWPPSVTDMEERTELDLQCSYIFLIE